MSPLLKGIRDSKKGKKQERKKNKRGKKQEGGKKGEKGQRGELTKDFSTFPPFSLWRLVLKRSFDVLPLAWHEVIEGAKGGEVMLRVCR